MKEKLTKRQLEIIIESQRKRIGRRDNEITRLQGVIKNILSELTEELDVRNAMFTEIGVEEETEEPIVQNTRTCVHCANTVPNIQWYWTECIQCGKKVGVKE